MGNTPATLIVGLAYQSIDAAVKAIAFGNIRLACTYLQGVAKLIKRQAEIELKPIPKREEGQDQKKYEIALIEWYDAAYAEIMEAISNYVANFFDNDDM